MKKIRSILFSTRLMAILFIVFAAAMGIATFIENDYDTETSKVLVYNAWWFELIMLLFVINFVGNIFRYKLYKPQKLSTLLLHVAFLFILVGAGITRYISFEGTMPIKEGETSNAFFSEKTYIGINIDNGKVQKTPAFEKEILLSRIGNNNFNYTTNFKGEPIKVELINYIANAKKEFAKKENGESFIKLVESSNGGRHEHYIKNGTSELVHGILIGFNSKINNTIDFYTDQNNNLTIKPIANGNFLRMADQHTGSVVKDSVQPFNLLSLYNLSGLQFVIPELPITGTYKTKSSKDEKLNHELTFKITTPSETKKVTVNGMKYNINPPTQITVGHYNFRITYGAKELRLPFQLKLNDFELKKYPGSDSPMSFASEVTVISPKETFDYRIFMNHILDYQGYRFFQSSYNITSEYEETHLSVNYDFWGTTITYIGYFMLYAGLILILFTKGSRFSVLRKSLRKLKAKKAVVIALFLVGTSFGFSQHQHAKFTQKQVDSIVQASKVNLQHAEKFSKVVIQDEGGRMKPIHTYASEFLRKVTKSENFKGLNATQVFLSIQQNPRFWFDVPMIYIKKDNTKLRDIIGIPHSAKYASLRSFFDKKGNYLLHKIQEEAFKKKIKNKFEESVISVDHRVNLLYATITGSLLRLFPIPNDANHKWISQNELHTSSMKGMDSVFVRQILPVYYQTLQKSIQTKDYSKSDEILEGIQKFQQKYGAKVHPIQRKIDLEIFYNKHDIFKNLFWQYMLAGVVLFVLIIIQIFNTSKIVRILIKIVAGVIVLLFLYHTFGLGVRWYISGHAPWSNGYEAMIYVAWATMLFGLIFGRKSTLTIAATAFVVSMILWSAHLNWMDPAIGNLVPVLDSYWLMIHVSIIVASYGPFTLSMILGLLALLLISLTNGKNKKKLTPILKEVSIINEMSLTVGLVLLAIGNFLGGQWANESWGRYWGWDPKETWALISIMVYAFVIHARLIPKLNNRWLFNTLSVFAFASILMTFLGVNHLLSGLHSYAKGESAEIPTQIWVWLGFSIVLTIFAYFKYRKFYKK